MRLAISNIAWDVFEDDAVVSLLNHHQVDAIDIAPNKYFSDPALASDVDIAMVKSWWNTRGIEITGMQALMFGTTGLNLFGPPAVQIKMLDHLAGICRIGSALGSTRLVFGSPRNRDRQGLSDAQSLDISCEFFRKLGDIAAAEGVIICLEPNPECYGANYMTNGLDTSEVTRQIAHPAIYMQFDVGALTINRENPVTVLAANTDIIGHIHASEPHLVPLGDGGADHGYIAVAIRHYLPNHIVSIEMITTQDEPHLQAIGRALTVAERHYRGGPCNS